jgi:endonuclease YncB( thermonuclease family)
MIARRLIPLFTLLLFSFPLRAQSWRTVERIVDGDTIVLDGREKVRLIGVDTPETVDPRKPVEYFGKEASEFTRRSAEGKRVRLEYDWQRTDKYGRTLAYVYLEGGTFLNAEIIKQGYGHAYTQFPFRYMEEFRGYEKQARESGSGLWAENAAAPVAAEAGGTSPPGLPVASKVDLAPTERSVTETVYATRTGAKYHRASCRYLAHSQIPMALADAAARYSPCSVCRPPTVAASSATAVSEKKESSYSAPVISPAASSRCAATTKKGTQCSRRAQAGRAYCWQH